MHKLYIKPLNTLQYDYTERANHPDDAGCDLYVQTKTVCPAGKVTFLKYQIACEMVVRVRMINVAYLLVPRSSISKTPLRMANSVGIIDKTYRGEIMSAVDNISNEDYVVEQGTRLFQIVLPSLEEFAVQKVEFLSDTKRGTDGFGSTGV